VVRYLFYDSIFLTTNYAPPGYGRNQTLSWPINRERRSSAVAISANWGDGSTATLLSQSTAGSVTLTHKYSSGGTYQVTSRAPDKKATPPSLQVVALSAAGRPNNYVNHYHHPLFHHSLDHFWLYSRSFLLYCCYRWPSGFGARHQLYTLRNRLDQSERSAR